MTNLPYHEFVESVWLGSPAMDKERADLNFIGLAICEEAGEVAGKLKKMSRGDGNITYEQIAYELGDVLYYVTKLGNSIGFPLNDLLIMNINKLESRLDRGTMRGSGDER